MWPRPCARCSLRGRAASSPRSLILGLNASHDAGAALVDGDGAVLAASNEERYNRRKAYFGMPERSTADVLRIAGARPSDVAEVHVANIIQLSQPIEADLSGVEGRPLRFALTELADRAGLARPVFATQLGVRMYRAIVAAIARDRSVARFLSSIGVNAPLRRWDHHLTHLASAYYTSGWDDSLVVSNDGFGDGYCARIAIGRAGRLIPVGAIPMYHSLGNYYSYVTALCGFKRYYHAGKVTGLAAFGEAERTLGVFRERLTYDAARGAYRNRGKMFGNELAWLRRRFAGIPREHIAAGAQRHIEELLERLVADAMSRTGLRRVALAGGVHANVRANQRILELPGVEGVWVHPNMGDGGIALGAAYLGLAALKWVRPRPLTDVYLGPSFDDAECRSALDAAALPYERPADLSAAIAALLAGGKVVARFAGRLEYGPRALGHRSILAPATDPKVNQWLNERLKRTEFMPFAPVVLAEHAPEYFEGFDGRAFAAAELMTITYPATALCRAEAPAVVHVDGTARPQILRREVDPEYAAILDAYRARTDLRVLINTSFNMHEEPIVLSPGDAVRSFRAGGLDALALGPYLVR